MIHPSRICRQASPALVRRVPGYVVKGWIRTPRSPTCRLLTVPGVRPESRTPRQNGALLPGWLRPRCAFVSPGCGSVAATPPPAAATAPFELPPAVVADGVTTAAAAPGLAAFPSSALA